MNHSARARVALAHLGEVDPALAVLALWCEHRDDDASTRTRGNTILYGPSFESFGLAEQVGLVAHHVLHVALHHSDRQAALAERLGFNFDQTLFGIAADGLINQTLLLAGHAVPRPAIVLTDLLDAIDRPSTSATQALSEWDVDRLSLALHADHQTSEKAKKYGYSRDFSSDVETGPSGDEDGRLSAAEWHNQMLRALEAGRKAGTGIGRFGGFLADLSPARIPWEVQLRGLLTVALTDIARPSYRRPASRWVAATAQSRITGGGAEPAFQPGRARSSSRARVVVGLDTSSSIDAMTLSLFCSETEGVGRRSDAEVHVLAFDEVVHSAQRMDTGAWRSLRQTPLRTGGGTNYGPVMEAATRLCPSILVMLTDLDATLGIAPSFPVLWVVPGRAAVDAPFGRVLRIDT